MKEIRFFLPKVEIKDYNAVIDGKNFFDQPIKNDKISYNGRKIASGQGGDYTTGFLLVYIYFNEHYESYFQCMISLDAYPKLLQQISFTGNLQQDRNTQFFFIIEEPKETVLDCSKGVIKVL